MARGNAHQKQKVEDNREDKRLGRAIEDGWPYEDDGEDGETVTGQARLSDDQGKRH